MQVADPITMGEGCTPLLRRTLHGAPVLLKCEWFMPTGSFKDRGASVMLSLLRAQGVRAVLEDSSGNGGAAVAAYAAAGGMQATIMAPASTSPAKTVQMRAHGADGGADSRLRGRTPRTRRCARSESVFYASHNWQPFFLHGTKTLAYELWEDLGFRAPDNVIVPCGAGSNVLGCEIGFSELLRAGEIDAMPRIFAAQPANCAPIAAAFLAGSDAQVPTEISPPSPRAPRSRSRSACARCWARCARRRGGAVMLTRGGDRRGGVRPRAHRHLCRADRAQVAAAFAKLLAAGTVRPEQTTVLVLTGSGLKATPRIAELLGITL